MNSSLTKDKALNIVLVQPSPYGSDNTVLLHLLRKLRDDRAQSPRAIAVVDIASTSDEELWSMHNLGVRGLRINMQADGKSTDVEALRRVVIETAARIKALLNWKMQLFCAASIWDDLFDTISKLPVEVIVDHVGGLRGSSKLEPTSGTQAMDPTEQPGFGSLVRLAEASKVIIKISGLYRLSSRAESGYDDMETVIKALAERVPDRLIWGSDWPHTGEGKDRLKRGKDAIEEFRVIDNELIVRNLRNWIGSEETWGKVTARNPKKFYE
ncbi:hypothetical protein Brms1b_006754 [Colletotrichum noveboracense]|nr:hypothetical protein Brms1b_006754 [Colletotrichum noveboracense]